MPQPCPSPPRACSPRELIALPPSRLKPNPFSLSIYGDPTAEIDDLLPSIRDHGILVAARRGSRTGAGNLGSHFRAPATCLCPSPWS